MATEDRKSKRKEQAKIAFVEWVNRIIKYTYDKWWELHPTEDRKYKWSSHQAHIELIVPRWDLGEYEELSGLISLEDREWGKRMTLQVNDREDVTVGVSTNSSKDVLCSVYLDDCNPPPRKEGEQRPSLSEYHIKPLGVFRWKWGSSELIEAWDIVQFVGSQQMGHYPELAVFDIKKKFEMILAATNSVSGGIFADACVNGHSVFGYSKKFRINHETINRLNKILCDHREDLYASKYHPETSLH